MALPALEGDIILNDKSDRAFTQLTRNAEGTNRRLERTQQLADRAAASMDRLAQSRTGGFGGDGDGGGLTELLESMDEVEERSRRIQENLDALGAPDLGDLASDFTDVNRRADELSVGYRRLRRNAVDARKRMEWQDSRTHPISSPYGVLCARNAVCVDRRTNQWLLGK
jgi:methyl-accepting chemotaxis protein